MKSGSFRLISAEDYKAIMDSLETTENQLEDARNSISYYQTLLRDCESVCFKMEEVKE